MAAQSAEAQARDFLYELTNCASEYGFGKEEIWSVSLANAKQKATFEKKYYPLISTLLAPEIANTMPVLVAAKLDLIITGMAQTTIVKSSLKDEPKYLVAYVANRTMS
jgi:hypothetical protein